MRLYRLALSVSLVEGRCACWRRAFRAALRRGEDRRKLVPRLGTWSARPLLSRDVGVSRWSWLYDRLYSRAVQACRLSWQRVWQTRGALR